MAAEAGLDSFTFEGVLFDLDGTLVDSANAVRRYWQKVAADLSIDVDTVVQTSRGRRSIDTIGLYDQSKATWEYVNAMEGSIPTELAHDSRPVPGAEPLLCRLEAAGVPWAIVTSCTRALLFGWVTRLALPTPPQTVAAEDVAAGKPDPACYLLARERIGKNPHAPLLVVEDSPTGVRAGKTAGCKVLGVTTNVASDVLVQAGADWIVPDYTALSLEQDGEGRWRLKLGSSDDGLKV